MGIQEVLSTPRSPWQRAYIERVISTIRRECLAHVMVFDESSLRRILRSYFGLLSPIQNASVLMEGLARAAIDSTAGSRASGGAGPGRRAASSLRTTGRLRPCPP
jgi:transposase InsO family protein